MTGRMLARTIAICMTLAMTLAITACASAPTQQISILDALAAQSANGHPMSCAAMNAATVCTQTTRLSRDKSCECVDRQQLAGAKAFSF